MDGKFKEQNLIDEKEKHLLCLLENIKYTLISHNFYIYRLPLFQYGEYCLGIYISLNFLTCDKMYLIDIKNNFFLSKIEYIKYTYNLRSGELNNRNKLLKDFKSLREENQQRIINVL